MTVESVPWPVIVGIILTVVGVVSAWSVRVNAGERADASAKHAHERIDDLEEKLTEAKVSAARELGDFKEKAARDYATQAQMNNIENRVVQEIHRLGDRIDRVLQSRPEEG